MSKGISKIDVYRTLIPEEEGEGGKEGRKERLIAREIESHLSYYIRFSSTALYPSTHNLINIVIIIDNSAVTHETTRQIRDERFGHPARLGLEESSNSRKHCTDLNSIQPLKVFRWDR